MAAQFSNLRVTTASDGADRDSYNPSLNADGTKVAFASDSDFLSQGIDADQSEIWLFSFFEGIYLPIVIKN